MLIKAMFYSVNFEFTEKNQSCLSKTKLLTFYT